MSCIKSSTLQLVTHTGARVVLTSQRAPAIRDLIQQFSIEARSSQYEYARALADFPGREENSLPLQVLSIQYTFDPNCYN